MTTKPKEKQFHHQLQAVPNGEFYFMKVDLDDPSAPKPISLNMTEVEVREFYHAKLGYSDAVIEERLRSARELKMA